ncbi:MAG: prepilin-type N-terminal cleavage/methylation domain-containing protein [Sedimentisphaerales bacterium]|nr:prepilin-type N-terminal cleavage/methylation domain-containing protein [Sedimentisphaerales bacterium]
MKKVKFNVPQRAFTLVEMLVTLAVISLLMSIMLPCLGMAKKQCHATICRSNIRQIYIANTGYALNNNDFYVLAAKDLSSGSGGRHRWHGVRQSSGVSPDPEKNTFDPKKGPLKAYLQGGKVKECPAKVKYVEEGSLNAFEAGCGGYGYNAIGIGSRSYQYGFSNKAMRSSMKISEIRQASRKIMFTDTAFAQGFPQKSYIIEYSFCEPPNWVMDLGKGIEEVGEPQPSIHFRHLDKTTVVWCDGHITAESLDFITAKSPDFLSAANTETDEFKIGWFGPENNSLFRPK